MVSEKGKREFLIQLSFQISLFNLEATQVVLSYDNLFMLSSESF